MKPFFRQKLLRGGSALVLVLWLIVVMTLVATVTARISRLDGAVSQLASEQIRCRWAARAGVETAVALLLEDERQTDNLTDLWADNPKQLEEIELEGCTFTVQVIDEASRLNLNTADPKQLAELDLMTTELLESILDWKDKDNEPRASGAEEGYYVNLSHGYSCRNGSFETVRELLLVRGMEPEYLYGSTDSLNLHTPLIQLLTCWSSQANRDGGGNARVNVNKAGLSKLKEDLSLQEDQAKWIEKHRPFKTLAELMDENKKAGGSKNQKNSNRSSSSRKKDDDKKEDEGKPLSVAALAKAADRMSLDGKKFVDGRVNINTAGLEVIEALFEGNRQLAENLVAARDAKEGGVTSFEEVRKVDGMTDAIFKKAIDHMVLRSSVFAIRCTATSSATGQTLKIKSIVNRDRNGGQVLYWRED